MKDLIILTSLTALLSVRCFGAPPPNDDFATATVESGKFWLVSGSLFGATSEPNEPILTGSPNGPTAWWRWTAPSSGTIRVSTSGSEQPNIVAVYSGGSLDTTRLLAYATSHANRGNAAEAEFAASAGETYSIQILGADYASPTFIPNPAIPSRVQLSLVYADASQPPPNNNFTNALILVSPAADVIVNTAGATAEPGEPLDIPESQHNTAWLVWTAPSNGIWQLDARQTDFDNVIAVYTGATVSSLTRLDVADTDYSPIDIPFVGGGRLTFAAQAGQAYHIQVQGASLSSAEFGNVRLLLQPVQPPPNDDFASATVLTGSAPTAEAWTSFAHYELGEPTVKPEETRTVWWRWTVPTSGLVAVIEYDGTMDAYVGTSLANLTRPPNAPNAVTRGSLGGVTDWYALNAGTTLWLRGSGLYDHVTFSLRVVQALANDDFADRKTLSGASASDFVDTEYASWEYNEPNTSSFGPKTVWYRWIAPSSSRYIISTEGSPYFTRVYVYTGTILTNLIQVGDEFVGNALYAYDNVSLDAVAGTEYVFQLRRESVATGLDHISIRLPHPPANDNFAAAIAMTGNAWTITGNTTDASSETNEPYSPFGGSSIWWQWTAPASGLYRASTDGSSIDSALILFTGTALNALTQVGQNQNSGWDSSASVDFAASAGTKYYLQVLGQSGEQGAVALHLAPIAAPPNDQFANRLLLTGLNAVAGGSLLGATLEAGELTIPGATNAHSVWYEWTAPASGTAFFRVTAGNFDPAFGLYTGNSLAALSPGITGGSGAASFQEQTFLASYPVNSGTSYKLRVDGAPNGNGSFRISVSMPTSPANDAFASRTILNGALVHSSANNEGATHQSGEPAHAGNPANFSVWWEWTAPTSGLVNMDTAGSTAAPRLAVYTGTVLSSLSSVASAQVFFPQNFSSLSFIATAGTKYVIATDSGDRSRGDIALTIATSTAIPPNDAFASATVWATDQAETLVRPIGATAESGEPAHGGRPAAKSLWWAWTPKTTRRAAVWMETQDSSILARLAIYKGSALNNLTSLSAQTADVHWDRREIDVLAGEAYYLVLDTPALALDPGWIKLGVVPVNGTLQNAQPISPSDGVVSAKTEGAFNEDPSQAPTALRQLWWTWVPEINARMEWRTYVPADSGVDISVSSPSAFFETLANATSGEMVPGTGELIGTFDAVAGALYYLKITTPFPQPVLVQLAEAPSPVPPANDEQYRATPMTAASWSVPITLGGETDGRLFWTWVAPADGVAQVSLVGTLATNDALLAYADGGPNLTAGASRTDGGTPVLRLASTAGQQWTIVTRSDLRRLRPATLSLVFPAPDAPPPNDSWLNAQVLPPLWSSVSGSVISASCQSEEPYHLDSEGEQVPPGRSVWYDWTPTNSFSVVLRLESSADLALQVYRGSTRPEWQPEAPQFSGGGPLTFLVLAGQTYHIVVTTRPYDEQTGTFTLYTGAAATNDMLASATILSGPSAISSANSVGATIEKGEPGHGFTFTPPRASLWWKWIAPANGLVWIDTLGSEYDTIVAVFASDPPDTAARVAENDNAGTRPGVTVSAVVFSAMAGQSYYIRVCSGETNEQTGIARVNLSMSAPSDPYSRWLALWPTLTGPASVESADPDGDGLANRAELAFGSNPLVQDSFRGKLRIVQAETGWYVEATVDRNALEALYGGVSLDIEWQVSRDLVQWQPGPPSQFVRREGRLSVERLLLEPGDPPFVRLAILKHH